MTLQTHIDGAAGTAASTEPVGPPDDGTDSGVGYR